MRVILPFFVIVLTMWIKRDILGLHFFKIFSSNIALNCMTIVVHPDLSVCFSYYLHVYQRGCRPYVQKKLIH